MQRRGITKQDIQCYQTGSSWLEVFGSVHMLVSTVCYCLFLSQSCLFAWALPCWQPRSIFSFLLALQVWALAKVLQRSAHCSPSFLKDRFFFISFDLILWSCFFWQQQQKKWGPLSVLLPPFPSEAHRGAFGWCWCLYSAALIWYHTWFISPKQWHRELLLW